MFLFIADVLITGGLAFDFLKMCMLTRIEWMSVCLSIFAHPSDWICFVCLLVFLFHWVRSFHPSFFAARVGFSVIWSGDFKRRGSHVIARCVWIGLNWATWFRKWTVRIWISPVWARLDSGLQVCIYSLAALRRQAVYMLSMQFPTAVVWSRPIWALNESFDWCFHSAILTNQSVIIFRVICEPNSCFWRFTQMVDVILLHGYHRVSRHCMDGFRLSVLI